MIALPTLPARGAPSFEEAAKNVDLDFTTCRARAAEAVHDTFEIVAIRTRQAHAPNRVVLVVDGDAAAGERTAALLRTSGYHPVVVTNPRDAARHMSSLGAPELLLLEADLPQMSGFEFLERMRGNRHVKDTPVVMLAARASREDLVRAFEAGADGYVTKSAGEPALLSALAQLLGD